MRLRKVHLSGFKSFVDPTTVELPGQLVGIVGPNGCGKSNIIDAVRWVMGEASAKHLRAGTMSDVVFNGSSSRKPVGQASVELIFDNHKGALGGRYASYNEISIRRQVGRDGHSAYFLNGKRCRRRDITDIFLGTGLGPRSYAVIEQGMISRMVEARPDELREFIEEAAGISQYKERRRETENRIRHTKENLSRLSDLREELGGQLRRLDRQARSAERYRSLKEKERHLEAERLALRWRLLNERLLEQERGIAAQEAMLEKAVAELRAIEADLERRRQLHGEQTEQFNEAYRIKLAASAEIARQEEAIEHRRRELATLEENLAREERILNEARGEMGRDKAGLEQVASELTQLEPRHTQQLQALAQAREQADACEEDRHTHQAEWEAFNERSAAPARAAHGERTRIEQLKGQIARVESRLERIAAECASQQPADDQQDFHSLEAELATTERDRERLQQSQQLEQEAVERLRQEVAGLGETVHHEREVLHTLQGKIASLEALQQEAINGANESVQAWLEAHQLADQSRLAEDLEAPGWELALETVLGGDLEAVCVDGGLRELATALETGFPGGGLAFLDSSKDIAPSTRGAAAVPLCERVESRWPVASLLDGIYGVDSLQAAFELLPELAPRESVVTPQGVWLGQNWVRMAREPDGRPGILSRERELKELKTRRTQVRERVDELEQSLREQRVALQQHEQEAARWQRELHQLHGRYGSLKSDYATARERAAAEQARALELAGEKQQLEELLGKDQQALASAENGLREHSASQQRLESERTVLQSARETLRERFNEARELWQAASDESHELGLKLESMRTRRQALEQASTRNRTLVAEHEQRRAELEEALTAVRQPLVAVRAELDTKLQAHEYAEQALKAARGVVEVADEKLRELSRQRLGREQAVTQERDGLDGLRLENRELLVRLQTLVEELEQRDQILESLLENLPDDALETDWDESLVKLARSIERLGAINLAAIDERSQLAERKEYLDAQNQDLVDALTTLEEAIGKIDRETRTRFRETFETVNNGFSERFPRLFGGGAAYLELTDEDLLNTGITVMARPPGKKNSTIHLLSGGEKALTAVALLFSIFDLKPAPFCLLDEVDAPLDDANVGRFCELVKDMATQVQMIVVTHNKVTMEINKQLIGVTMNEPGVSRLVAVDMDAAVELAGV